MTISVKEAHGAYEVSIDGTIKSVSDSQSIKDALLGCTDKRMAIRITITNSFSVTSSVIGFLLKKVQADKADISIVVEDERLLDLFNSLNLCDILRVSRN